MLLTVEQIIQATGGRLLQAGKNPSSLGISTDTRTLKVGQLFIPLDGANYRGHDFIPKAKTKGAWGSLCCKGQPINLKELEGIFVIEVEDILVALRKISTYYRNQFHIPFVAVTGSTGKTSTKDLISSILSEKYQVLKNMGNLNNQIGLPMTLFNLSKSHEVGVLEMGMSSFGEIHNLVEIVRPHVAVITNIGMSHIEHLGSRENILKAKLEIAGFLQGTDYLLINGDDPYLQKVKEQQRSYQCISYGLSKENDFYPQRVIDHGEAGFTISIKIMEEVHDFQFKYPGIHNVYNALVALWIGLNFEMTPEELQKGLNHYIPSKMRFEIHEKHNLKIINDAYNASPDSMKASLKVLDDMKGKRKIALLGDMFEMGSFSEEGHRMVGRDFANTNVNILISVGNMARWIAEEAETLANEKLIISVSNNQQAIEKLEELIQPEDIILIKGSRGMKMEEIVNYLLERS